MRLKVEARVRRSSGFSLEASLGCDCDAMGVVGPSGSGKTTLLEVIAGIEPGARVEIDGRDVSKLPPEERRVGYVTQDALLFPHLTVRENLLYSPRADGVEEVAGALGLLPFLDRRSRNLSGGERRRAALARAIASRPALLLLDEPFSGLDEPARREAISLLLAVRRRFRIPAVLVSHRPEEIVGLTTHAARLEGGRVTAHGPSASVLRAGETRVDNYFDAEVSGPGRVRAGDVELTVPLPEGTQGSVRLAVYAHDILLAGEVPRSISARNCFWTTVTSLEPAGSAVLVGLGEPSLRALLTREAVEALELRPGTRTVAVVKATSIAYLG